MNTVPKKEVITFAVFMTLVKSTAVGILLAETWQISRAAAVSTVLVIEVGAYQVQALLSCAVLIVITLSFAYTRNIHLEFAKIVRSHRADVLVTLVSGVGVSFAMGGFGSAKYERLSTAVHPSHLLAFVGLLALIGVLLAWRSWLGTLTSNSEEIPPFFINDIEKSSVSDDLLNLSDDAARFADSVINGGSKESVVFGIDAPWGIGKSSFINFCIEHWTKQDPERQIVYKFNVLQYADRTNLLEKFVDGLVRTIQKQVFAPELRPIASKYARFIGSRGKLSQWGLSLDLMPGEYTLDDALDDLEGVIGRLDKRLIVIIDDLDRLNFGAVKEILFAIKKSFTLPNVSYVLCYDTENIVAQREEKADADKVREFLEKFINVKISLFLDTKTLAKYISDNFAKAVQNNLQLNPLTVEKTRQAIDAIKKIYEASDFYNYQPFLGDIRKLKRLINTLVLLEIQNTDFENADFDKFDLIHLLLIYINYPNIFRRIYNSETNGRRGFFSLVTERDEDFWEKEKGARHEGLRGAAHYGNSNKYVDYVATLSNEQKFLLDKIFGVARLEDPLVTSVEEELKKTYACFNGSNYGGDRNLEKYLHLIVRLAKPQKTDQYKFYINCKKRLLEGISIQEIFSGPEFDVAKGEKNRQQFLRIVVNSSDELRGDAGRQVISYLLNSAAEYSLIEIGKLDVGLRDNISFFLIKLLDAVGWVDSSGRQYDNSDSNVRGIAEWIFGEGQHLRNGILERLFAEERGSLGLFDAMIFRLYCSVDRGGNFFNLQKSLTLHANSNAQAPGEIKKLVIEEMREISQRVFAMFRQRYIDAQRNLFEEIQAVSPQDLAGRYWPYIEAEREGGNISAEERDQAVGSTRTRMEAFITYQLANRIVGSGVGCGYYDEDGTADGNGISRRMNDYLLDFCFNLEGGMQNGEHFLDYLLINFSSTFGVSDRNEYLPSVSEFTKVLDGARLAQYWKRNKSEILGMNFLQKQKRIFTANYTATYSDDLTVVFETLDKVVAEHG